MRIVVVGGTGLIGSAVVNLLRDHGVDVGVASLRTGVDARTGRGLGEALRGAHVVIDALNVNRPAHDYEQAPQFFATSTRNVLAAGRRAGVHHHLALSVVGAREIQGSYFVGKTVQEELVEGSGTAHTVLRATLLLEHLPRLIDRATTTHFVRLPPVKVQPVAAGDVVREVCRLALGWPVNGAFEIAGPEVHFLDELARRALASVDDHRTVRPDSAAAYLGARLDPGTEVLLPSWRLAEQTPASWLASRADT